MLQIKDVKYGLVPFGSAYGSSALWIDFEEIETEEENEITLFNRLLKIIEDKNLNNEWLIANNGSHTIFIIFNGGIIEKEKHRLEWDAFNLEHSRYALEIQKTLKLRPDQLRPPFTIWSGEPKEFTGKRQFYQYFNCIYALVKSDNYAQLALQELINHQFSAVCLLDFTLINEITKKYNVTHKLYVIDNLQSEDVINICYDRKLKYHNMHKGPKFLELI